MTPWSNSKIFQTITPWDIYKIHIQNINIILKAVCIFYHYAHENISIQLIYFLTITFSSLILRPLNYDSKIGKRLGYELRMVACVINITPNIYRYIPVYVHFWLTQTLYRQTHISAFIVLFEAQAVRLIIHHGLMIKLSI